MKEALVAIGELAAICDDCETPAQLEAVAAEQEILDLYNGVLLQALKDLQIIQLRTLRRTSEQLAEKVLEAMAEYRLH